MQDNEKKESTWEFWKPVVVLTVICLVVSTLVALTDHVTRPIITEAELERANATRFELLPSAEGFEEVECDIENVTSVYKDTAGSGYIVTVTGKGYKGDLPVTVGFDADGVISGISVDASGESAGVGSRTQESTFTERFIGLTGSADSVDTLSGATISSKAVKKAVNTAFDAYNAVKEG